MDAQTDAEPRVEIGCHERIAGALMDYVAHVAHQEEERAEVGKGLGFAFLLTQLAGWAEAHDLTLNGAWVDGRWVQESFRHALLLDPNVTREQLHYWLCEASDEERKKLPARP